MAEGEGGGEGEGVKRHGQIFASLTCSGRLGERICGGLGVAAVGEGGGGGLGIGGGLEQLAGGRLCGRRGGGGQESTMRPDGRRTASCQNNQLERQEGSRGVGEEGSE